MLGPKSQKSETDAILLHHAWYKESGIFRQHRKAVSGTRERGSRMGKERARGEI